MQKTTVMLDLKGKALFKAREMGISTGELIRKSIENFIDQQDLNRDYDPFIDDNEFYEGEIEGDLSVKHDKHIYLIKA